MSKNKSRKRKKPKEIISHSQLSRHVEVPFSDRDDLTLIDGILPQIELALNGIGIRKFSDFKDYTSESLAKMLQQKVGIDILSESIENQKWIESALVLADKNHTERNSEKEPEKVPIEKNEFKDEEPGVFSSAGKITTPVHQEKELEGVPLSEKSFQNISNNDGDGKLLTSDELDKKEMINSDYQRVEKITKKRNDITLDNLIAVKSSVELKQEPVQKYSKSLKKSDSDHTGKLDDQKQKLLRSFEEKVTLKIIDAKYNQVELPMTANTLAKKVMHGEIRCNLTGKNAILETQYRFTLYTQILAVDVETEQSEIIASKSFQLTPQQDGYRVHLEFEVPKAGYYRLNAVVFLLAPEPKIDCKEGPFLRVIPEQNYSS